MYYQGSYSPFSLDFVRNRGVVINNNTDGKKATAMNMSAFRITKTEAEFTITKVLSTDNSVKISIIKHSDDDQNVVENFEKGAEFEIYLKSAGSYDNAKDSERDYFITDENGFAETKKFSLRRIYCPSDKDSQRCGIRK